MIKARKECFSVHLTVSLYYVRLLVGGSWSSLVEGAVHIGGKLLFV